MSPTACSLRRSIPSPSTAARRRAGSAPCSTGAASSRACSTPMRAWPSSRPT
jgi:hypothetical protein